MDPSAPAAYARDTGYGTLPSTKGAGMARKVQVVIQDDLDGREPAQSIRFGLEGIEYEIDLTEQNADEFRTRLAPWIAAARVSEAPIPEPRSASGSSAPADIRRWAADNGIPVQTRGRISIDLRSKYEAAH